MRLVCATATRYVAERCSFFLSFLGEMASAGELISINSGASWARGPLDAQITLIFHIF